MHYKQGNVASLDFNVFAGIVILYWINVCRIRWLNKSDLYFLLKNGPKTKVLIDATLKGNP